MSGYDITFTNESSATKGTFHTIPIYDSTKQEHFWVVLLAYNIDPTENLIVLTKECLVSLQPAFCYHCEKDYDELIVRRPCAGRKLEKV